MTEDEKQRILSNRWGPQQNGAPPAGLPSDPRFLELAVEKIAARRWRTAALVAIFSLGCVTALFVAATVRRHELETQLARERLVCARLPIALQSMKLSITRGTPDEIAKRAAAASLLINSVLGPCIGDNNAPSFYAQRLTEAPDMATVGAVVDEMIARLR